MENAERKSTAYVVYPAALCDGWEVVREDDEPLGFARQEQAIRYAQTRAAMDGGGVVKLENWFGDLERIWEVAAPEPVRRERALEPG